MPKPMLALRSLPVFLLLLTAGVPAVQAGELFTFASSVNGVIRGEIQPAAEGAVVEITGPDGRRLGETVLDADGRFTWTPAEAVAHTFSANLGEGLVARLTVPAEDIHLPASGAAAALPDDHALRALVAEAVESQVRPLRRELAEYKDQAGVMDALGGIGYIFGIFGVAAWVASRRARRAAA